MTQKMMKMMTTIVCCWPFRKVNVLRHVTISKCSSSSHPAEDSDSDVTIEIDDDDANIVTLPDGYEDGEAINDDACKSKQKERVSFKCAFL